MITSINPTPVMEMAQVALESMGDIVCKSAFETGDSFLARIEADAPGLHEKSLAKHVREATQDVPSTAGLAAQKVALRALAAGLTGPPARILATAGCQALEAMPLKDARRAGARFLSGVQHMAGEKSPEAVVAQVTLNAAQRRLSPESASRAELEALRALSVPIPPAPDSVLVAVAAAACTNAKDDADFRTLAWEFLAGVRDHATQPQITTLAQVAYDVSSETLTHETGKALQKLAYELLPQAQDRFAADLVCQYAEKAFKLAKDQEVDAISRSLLGGIARTAPADGARNLAGAVQQSIPSLSGWARTKVTRHALGLLASQWLPHAEDGMVQLGVAIPKIGLSNEDARTLGQTLLLRIATESNDEAIRQSAERAMRDAAAVPSEAGALMRLRGIADAAAHAVAIQQAGFTALQGAVNLRIEQEKGRKLKELEKMAEAFKPADQQKAAGQIEVQEEEVVVGGIRLDRNT